LRDGAGGIDGGDAKMYHLTPNSYHHKTKRSAGVKAIEILVDEHRLISENLDLLTAAAEKIVRNQNPPKEFFEKAVTFTRNFTNKFHHYKEEIVMFGLLAQKHEGAIDAEIERLRSQHDMLHNYMNEVSDSLDAYSKGAESEVRKLHKNLNDYINTLRGHIAAENRIFYPLVERTTTDDEKKLLLAEFDKYATEEGPEAVKNYGALVEEMAGLI
jgi:hemerythrin-like domain-containing protein